MAYRPNTRDRIEATPRRGTKARLKKKAAKQWPPITYTSYINSILEDAAKGVRLPANVEDDAA